MIKQKTKMRQPTNEEDMVLLSELNARFIKNFITRDVAAHEKIIHEDFVCIENSGAIVNRADYMKAWAHDYEDGGFTSFTYTDECIRLFGNTALVRSKTVYTKIIDGTLVEGNSIYTDTYVKENGKWLCVQAHITPIRR